jgi:hypothetical protein
LSMGFIWTGDENCPLPVCSESFIKGIWAEREITTFLKDKNKESISNFLEDMKMSAETSLFCRYLSALKHTEYQHAQPKGK